MFPNMFREFRHNPCLMTPLTFVGVLILAAFWTLAFVWKFPLLALGYLLNPLVNRTSFMIEFLYPLSLGRWVHLTIVRMLQRSAGPKSGDKNRGFHSRTIETRIEVVPGRLYIHPLPQLLDNLAYLVVCCPEQVKEVTVVEHNKAPPPVALQHNSSIVAFLVDCGDANSTLKQLQLLSEAHYCNQKIHVQAILSTHKHHDHTAGNIPMFRHKTMKGDLTKIVGGAVEKIPGCNHEVGNGDMIDLPKHGINDMAGFIEVEAIATPAHTRGSITYALRLRPDYIGPNSAYGFLFTGDTMFSAGGGVPFEADVDPGQEQQEPKQTFTSIIKASSSLYAVERCFAEILARALKTKSALPKDMADRVLIMPGHEYTHELLSRQMTAGNVMDNCRWKNFTPHVFFATVSQLYVTLHRRSLPYSSGKLVSAMGSPVSMEMSINPYFRSMRKRGDAIIQAVQFWHKQFARKKIPDNLPRAYYDHFANLKLATSQKMDFDKTASNESQWNLDAADLTRPVFTTVYASEFDSVIRDLSEGAISSQEGASRLAAMKDKMKQNSVSKRPVPSTLSSDRAVYRGLLALALLGSSPTAMTLSDAKRMNLPKPVNKTSDRILVSKSHLIAVLQWLGLLTLEDNGPRIIAMIHQLWQEALEDSPSSGKDAAGNRTYDTIDTEADPQDKVELGDLKWSIYGVPRQQSSLRLCMPCVGPQRVDPKHPAYVAGMKPHSGEIVRHDVYSCEMCRTRAGCAFMTAGNEEENATLVTSSPAPTSRLEPRPVLASIGSMPDGTEEQEDSMFVEVTSLFKEA